MRGVRPAAICAEPSRKGRVVLAPNLYRSRGLAKYCQHDEIARSRILNRAISFGVANCSVVIPTASEFDFGYLDRIEISGRFRPLPTRVCVRRPPNGKLVDFRGFATKIRLHSNFLLDFGARERPGARLLSPLHASCAICTIKNHECLHYRHICFCSFERQFSLTQCLGGFAGSRSEQRFFRRTVGVWRPRRQRSERGHG